MALDFWDTFDQYGALATVTNPSPVPAPLNQNGYGFGGGSGPVTYLQLGSAYGRFAGSIGLRLQVSSGEGYVLIPPSFGNNATEYASFALYISSLGPGGLFAQFLDLGTTQIEFRLLNTGQVQI